MPPTATPSASFTSRFVEERQGIVDMLANTARVAEMERRDLTDAELDTVSKLRARLTDVDAQIEALAEDWTMQQSTSDRLRAIAPAMGDDYNYRSVGQAVWDLLHQSDDTARSRMQRSMRAAQHMGIGDAAGITPVAGTVEGMIVNPVVGPVTNPSPRGMPLAVAIGITPSDNAMHFLRPRVDDPDFATGVDVQALQKAELASKAFDIVADPVSLTTVGGYLNISQQLVSFAPSALGLIVSQMNRRLASKIDAAIIVELAKSTGKVTLAAGADAAAILKAITDGAVAVYNATGEMPSLIAMGPLGWARLASLTDGAGRPLFPAGAGVNALGTAAANELGVNPVGLRGVVTPAITDDTYWLMNGDAVETYAFMFPMLEAIEPSVLGRQIAVAAAIGNYRPVANGAVHLAP